MATSTLQKCCWLGRWLSILAIGSLVLIAGFFYYLSQSPAPNWLTKPLISELRDRGFDLKFRELRVRGANGVVATGIRLVSLRPEVPISIDAEVAELRLDPRSWQNRKLQLQTLVLKDATLQIIESLSSNQPVRLLVGSQFQFQARLASSNDLRIETLSGLLNGIQLDASGQITNFSWDHFFKRTPSSRTNWLAALRRIQSTLNEIRFPSPPAIELGFFLDLDSPEEATGKIHGRVPGIAWKDLEIESLVFLLDKPPNALHSQASMLSLTGNIKSGRWRDGRANDLKFSTEIALGTNQNPTGAQWRIQARGFTNQRVEAEDFQAVGQSKVHSNAGTIANWLLESRVKTSVATIGTLDPVGKVSGVQMSGNGQHTLHGWTELSVTSKIDQLAAFTSRLDHVNWEAKLRPSRYRSSDSAGLGFWRYLQGIEGSAQIAVGSIETPQLELGLLEARAGWADPKFILSSFSARAGEGSISGAGALDIVDRQVEWSLKSGVDLHRFHSLLTPSALNWIRHYGWGSNEPPVIEASGRLILASWTNRHPDWHGEVKPSLQLEGQVRGNNLEFRGLPAASVDLSFDYTNSVWHLPSVRVETTSGPLEFEFTHHEDSQDYHFKFQSRMDPQFILPLLETADQKKALLSFQQGERPQIVGEVFGKWRDRDRLGFAVHLNSSNVTYRSLHADRLVGDLVYTNGILSVENAEAESNDGRATVRRLVYNHPQSTITIDAGDTTLPVEQVVGVLGSKMEKHFAPFHFHSPTRVILNGTLPTRYGAGIGAEFTVEAAGFDWGHLHMTNTSAILFAQPQLLIVSNVAGGGFDGRIAGNVVVDFAPTEGTSFRFDAHVTDLSLQRILVGFQTTTNRLDGLLSGRLAIDSANTWNTNSWQGRGQVTLRDGYLWNLPLFGFLSQPLDAIIPGAGQSRFKSGSAMFIITNSVLATENLEINSATMKLHYSGTVLPSRQIHARVEAKILRDTPLVGPLLTLALSPLTKLFEYQIQGTLAHPEVEPSYIPRIFLAPFSPLKSLRELFSSDAGPSIKTNAPPPLSPVENSK